MYLIDFFILYGNQRLKYKEEIKMELILTNITKKYGNYEAISNQSLILKNGVYGLLGVNGAGKTTYDLYSK